MSAGIQSLYLFCILNFPPSHFVFTCLNMFVVALQTLAFVSCSFRFFHEFSFCSCYLNSMFCFSDIFLKVMNI
ncbi:hypothetical protein OIU74_007794 [Salix koriyanagi]|uniref:Uncharacterized protein n=1 Tax=Salix koriyanagi TaxID=2511006 RepID=A0A9Q0Z6U6_9ROSI|nr:hypothetical protein OIU74_007794 [Salix koriyanagi]